MPNQRQLRFLKPNSKKKITPEDVKIWNKARSNGTIRSGTRCVAGDPVDLRGVQLDGDLSGIDLKQADLRLTDFTDADLTNADLSKCNLQGATLTGANFTGAKLHDVKFDQPIKMLATVKGLDKCWGLAPDIAMIVLTIRTRQLNS